MKTTYDILLPDGTSTSHEVGLPAEPSYANLCSILDPVFGEGVWWEHVSILLPDDTRSDMFVDEMGHPKELPVNKAATVHYLRASHRWGRPQGIPVPIVGPAVVFHRRVWY